jgi:hypothetical protein
MHSCKLQLCSRTIGHRYTYIEQLIDGHLTQIAYTFPFRRLLPLSSSATCLCRSHRILVRLIHDSLDVGPCEG